MEGALIGWAITGFFLPTLTSREIAFTVWFLIGATLHLPTTTGNLTDKIKPYVRFVDNNNSNQRSVLGNGMSGTDIQIHTGD